MLAVTASSDRIPETIIYCLSKNEATWYKTLVGFKTPNKIQSQEYSRDGGIDGVLYKLVRLPQ